MMSTFWYVFICLHLLIAIQFIAGFACFKRYGKGAVNSLGLSAVVFLGFYEQAFALISKNETMPHLIK